MEKASQNVAICDEPSISQTIEKTYKYYHNKITICRYSVSVLNQNKTKKGVLGMFDHIVSFAKLLFYCSVQLSYIHKKKFFANAGNETCPHST